jgi:hypothetical protein
VALMRDRNVSILKDTMPAMDIFQDVLNLRLTTATWFKSFAPRVLSSLRRRIALRQCLVAEADNNVFGQARNTVVSHLTCNGSSGGEGSVVAFKGSALGIGTDVGGSIR